MIEKEIQDVVAERAAALGGGRVEPDSVEVLLVDAHAAPGCAIYRARWHNGALSAVVIDGEGPDTFPAQALGKIFRRWIDTTGALPDAMRAARVAAWIYDPERRRTVIFGEEDIGRPDWLPHLRPPVRIDDGVVFWWVDPRGPSEVRVSLDPRSGTRIAETPLHLRPAEPTR